MQDASSSGGSSAVQLAAATPASPVRVGRYDVVGLLRAGGMGTVYEAVDRDRSTRVALKTLTHLDASSLLRFKSEFRSVADLSHPNLVPLYELGCHEGLWFFTMERIDGVDFLSWIRGLGAPAPVSPNDDPSRRSDSPTKPIEIADFGAPEQIDDEPTPSLPPSLTRLREALAQLVHAVRALHEARLLHLDLKPSNVLVEPSGRVVLLDFGLVRSTTSPASTSTHPSAPPTLDPLDPIDPIDPIESPRSVRFRHPSSPPLSPPQLGDPEAPSTLHQGDTSNRTTNRGERSEDTASENEAGISGTPGWMAPERFSGQAVAEPADWYGVGLMLYRALTGVSAFPPASVMATWYARQHLPPVPPNQLVHGIPDDLSALTSALLSPDPARRPTGADLVAFVTGDPNARPIEEKPPTEPAQSGFVGRELERATLRAALDHVRHGGAALVDVSGPSGVGKTALLRGLFDQDDRGDLLVLRGRCYERESIPYKAFDAILDQLALELVHRPDTEILNALPRWVSELTQVFPVLGRVPAIKSLLRTSSTSMASSSVIELRRRAVEALRQLVEQIARRRPVILEIDDLQWSDADSISLLQRLLAAPAPPGLLIALAFRSGEQAAGAHVWRFREFQAAIRHRDDLRHISLDLAPLSTDDATRLARRTLASLGITGHTAETLAKSVATEAQGVPFYIEELAHFAADCAIATRESQGASATIALEHVLARRVQLLPDAERSLVETLAVANNPIPLSVGFAVAGLDSGALRALWSLRGAHFVRTAGRRADERIELHHDGMRESVLRYLSHDRQDELHVALGRALAAQTADPTGNPWLFDAVRHLNSATSHLAVDERITTARLNLVAAQRARRAAAFPLAFDCFHAGAHLLDANAWERDYDLALALHSGAAETAYLSASWSEIASHLSEVKTHARTLLDHVVAWEVEIDAHIARSEFVDAVNKAIEALRLLGVQIPENPGEAEIVAEIGQARESLAPVGPEGLVELPDASDPHVDAAMRIETRIGSATYFARPMLFPVLACRQVVSSVRHGLSPATPYALSVYGIVLNTLGQHRDAHVWGQVALGLIDRFDDRSLEARTRHVVHDLVCTWTVPLASTLDDLRAVVAIGQSTGDLEYAGYAAHAYIHNSFYAGRHLEGLLQEALSFGAFMRGHGQVNALHVHAPFEQLLRCFTGRTPSHASLDSDGFSEARAIEAARNAGSRSALCILGLLMGIVRFHAGEYAAASAFLEDARQYLDGVASNWHVPILHQYAALTALRLPRIERERLAAVTHESLQALRALAVSSEENFAHRVFLIEASAALAADEIGRAVELCHRAILLAERGRWYCDLVLAHDTAARAQSSESARAAHIRAKNEALQRWGAR